MGALGVYKCVICLSLPAFLQGGVDQKLKKTLAGSKKSKSSKGPSHKPWQAQKNQQNQQF